jgi:hypothetical protein
MMLLARLEARRGAGSGAGSAGCGTGASSGSSAELLDSSPPERCREGRRHLGPSVLEPSSWAGGWLGAGSGDGAGAAGASSTLL